MKKKHFLFPPLFFTPHYLSYQKKKKEELHFATIRKRYPKFRLFPNSTGITNHIISGTQLNLTMDLYSEYHHQRYHHHQQHQTGDQSRPLMTSRLPSWGEPILPPVWKASEEEINRKFPFPEIPGEHPHVLLGPLDQHRLDTEAEKSRSLMLLAQKDADHDLLFSLSLSTDDCRQMEEDDIGVMRRNGSEYYTAENSGITSQQDLYKCHGSPYTISTLETNDTFQDALDNYMDIDSGFPVIPLPPPPPSSPPPPRLESSEVRQPPDETRCCDEPSSTFQFDKVVPITWILETCQGSSQDLSFKLMIAGGASMILFENEVIESIKVLSEARHPSMFRIKSSDGASLWVDSSQVVSKVCEIVDQEISKKKERREALVIPSRASPFRAVLQSRRRRCQDDEHSDDPNRTKKTKTGKRQSRFRAAWKALALSRRIKSHPPAKVE